MSECKTKCKMCDKRGLPILLTRYAIAPHDSGAPEVQGGFIVTDQGGAKIELKDAAMYTQRLLRSGYLYVFDEKRNRWYGYFITPDGYYMPFDIPKTGPTPPAITGNPKKIVPCNPEKNGVIAGCITLSTPTEAGKVWFGFSDVEWTKTVWQRHQEASYRKLHMREFDVAKWLGSGTHRHAGGIHLHASYIAEYTPGLNKKTFAFSPAQFNQRTGQSKALIHDFENLNRGKGVFVALNDPAGLAMDLATLMTSTLNAFMTRTDHHRKLTVSTAIQSIQAGIYRHAEEEAMADADMAQGQMLAQSNGMLLMTESGRRSYDAMGKVSADTLEDYKTKAWKKYQTSYHEPERAKFQKEFDKKLGELDASYIGPLAVAHAAWMKSQRMANVFECNFDEHNTDSGQVYTSVLSLCVGATQDKQACFDLYSEWMHGRLDDKKNLLLRGLILNQGEYAKVIAKGATVSVDPRGLPWDGMIGGVGASIDRTLENKPDLIGRLIVQMTGPIMRSMKTVAESGALPEALVAVGVVSKAPILRIEFKGNLRDFQAYVVEELIKARGETLPPHGLKAAVNRELRLMQIKGIKLEGTRQKKFLVIAGLDDLEKVAAGGKQTERAKALAKALANVDELRKMELSRWRQSVNKGVIRLKGSLPLAFGAVAALLQWVALGKLTEDLEKANKTGKDKDDATWRYRAGWAAFGGTVAESLGTAVSKIPLAALRLGPAASQMLAQGMRVIGKGLGVVGAGIVAFWDFKKGLAEQSKGNQGLALGYFSSALLGMAGTLIIMFGTFAAATGVGLILILLALCISVLIEYFKPNPVQEWLKQSFFGNKSFRSLDEEMLELQRIYE
ncbi:T6SS effector BTH_I2691 family protein [Chitiniphilus eburneus]|uniref:Toxin VasX N-terminal region domain-containing protein n=1 Tax=Chitiniphilus eburneus TaxID=2571148 RepID=A0A4U0QBI7_9NEIS|nr:T6SS effector BTH_I2691 family protein [Chitiniphilus eburneus]TJZ78715.1 hypothetical protein FAZ21_00015 [Chitiniphilus eburneus]